MHISFQKRIHIVEILIKPNVYLFLIKDENLGKNQQHYQQV